MSTTAVQYDTEGHEYAFHGEYREIVALERVVYAFEFEGTPGHGILETVTRGIMILSQLVCAFVKAKQFVLLLNRN